MDAMGNNSAEMLRSYARRIVRLEDEREEAKANHVDPLTSDIKDIKAEAKSQGFDPKLLAAAIKRARMDASDREILELYEAAVVSELLGDE